MACAGMVSAASAQVSYGLKAGLNLAELGVSGKVEGEIVSRSTGTIPSFYVTGFAEIPVALDFAVQPGISLQGKGGGDDEIAWNFMSIEVPINVVYYYTGTTGSLFFGAGPYLGVNIAGTLEDDGEKEDLEFGPNALNRLDYGLNFMGGFKFPGGFLMNVGYGLGLANVIPEGPLVTTRHRVLSFGIGFAF